MFEIDATILSPGINVLTPSGVPVNIRSPFTSGISFDISLMISRGDQIISPHKPDCLSVPLTSSFSSRSRRSLSLTIGTIPDIGALPAKHYYETTVFLHFWLYFEYHALLNLLQQHNQILIACYPWQVLTLLHAGDLQYY